MLEIIVNIYMLGVFINIILVTYRGIFRKDFKTKIQEVARSGYVDIVRYHLIEYPKIFFIYLIRIFGSWFTTRQFISDIKKSQKYSFQEIKKAIFIITLISSIVISINFFGLDIYFVKIFNYLEKASNYIENNIFLFLGSTVVLSLSIAVATVILTVILQSFRKREWIKSLSLKLHKI